MVGVLSALAMLLVATITYPLFVDGTDLWSFPKVVASALLGADAATPLDGFSFGPVLLGLVLHFVLGTFAGVTYALLVALFDLEGWTPVALFGILYGAMLFVWSAAVVGAGIGGDAIQDLPLAVMFWANVAFGLTAGALLATWADAADLDQDELERVPAFEERRAS